MCDAASNHDPRPVRPARVGRLPDPDTIRETEYLAVWEALTNAVADLPEDERDEHALVMLGRLRGWVDTVERWLRGVPPCHIWDEETDMCAVCRASLSDGGLGVGCEAGPEGNSPGYTGLALTPAEQAAGVTYEDKFEAIFGGRPEGSSLSADEKRRRLRAFSRRHHSQEGGQR